jgi:hypothetical protein
MPEPATAGVSLPPLPAAPASNVPAAAEKAASKPPRKPVKFDPALLERALTNKYAPN